MPFKNAPAYLRRHGLWRSLHRAAYKLLYLATGYMTMRCIWVQTRDLRYETQASEVPYEAKFLEPRELLELAQQDVAKRAGLDEAFVRFALEREEKCLAILDGPRIAAFTWYTDRSPAMLNDEWEVHFDPSCVYIYFVFTDAVYRGKRLLAAAVSRGLAEFAKQGKARALAFVESPNYASLRAFYRMGFQDFGTIRHFKLFGKPFVFRDKSCDRFQFRVAPNQSPIRRPAKAQLAFR